MKKSKVLTKGEVIQTLKAMGACDDAMVWFSDNRKRSMKELYLRASPDFSDWLLSSLAYSGATDRKFLERYRTVVYKVNSVYNESDERKILLKAFPFAKVQKALKAEHARLEGFLLFPPSKRSPDPASGLRSHNPAY